MLKIIEKDETLEVQSALPVGQRILFLLLAAFPLIAPYQLIIQPRWESIFNLFFLFAAMISIGALTLSAFLVWAAIAGLDFQTVFDRRSGMFTHTVNAPLLSKRASQHAIDSIEELHIEKHDWSEGRPTYTLHLRFKNGTALRLGSSWLRHELDAIAGDIYTFLEK